LRVLGVPLNDGVEGRRLKRHNSRHGFFRCREEREMGRAWPEDRSALKGEKNNTVYSNGYRGRSVNGRAKERKEKRNKAEQRVGMNRDGKVGSNHLF